MFTALSAMVVAVTMTLPSASVFGAEYSQELQDAYNWAHDKGVTTMDSIDNANMYGAITRAEMAKMLSVYATKVLNPAKEADTSAACTFTDIDSVKGDLHDYIIESCQLGIMGQNMPNNAFRPYDTISRAEFGTALSRVLWGDQYNGGTPYYANHLNALKANAIMNQIANAESTKEIRGYVMLMLMRSELWGAGVDCTDADIMLACLDPELEVYANCPAACREDANKDENWVVKSGDLAVTAKATEWRRARVPGVSDLDTLTFKTSEDVNITKVTLERYGYSSQDDVDEVRLEDQDGNVIADGKSLSKDKVTLSIKKDYRSVDGTFVATVVAKLTGSNVGGTIGFKVIDAESSAKNLNLDDYTPYTYEMVSYSGNTITVDVKGTNKDYNYEEGESYEIARLKVKAGSSIVYAKWFTLTNGATKALDMGEFLDKLTVKVDGKDVEGLKYSVNKDDQLVISFDEMTIDMNKSALFVISASLKDFDDYGDAVAYYLEEESDINAVEKKTGARLTVTGTAVGVAGNAISHAFNWGKIKLANTKLGNIDASQGSEDVVVAEGTVTVTEPISKISFTLNANNTYVSAMRMYVNGEEFEGKKSGTQFAFSNVEIAKSGKVQFAVDIEDNDNATGAFTVTSNINKDTFAWAKYDNSRKYVETGDVAGTISFSKVTIQAAKATLKNTISDSVEFINGDTSDLEEVFKWTYTAKKALINLNKFYIEGANPLTGVTITYHLYVNGEEVADTDTYGSGAEEIFDDVVVEAGKSVDILVKAQAEAYGSTWSIEWLKLVLWGTDEYGKDVAYKNAKLVDLKVVEKGAVKVEAGASKNTVLRTSNTQDLAEFTVKSSNSASTQLTDLVFTIAGSGTAGVDFDSFTKDDIDISSVDIDECSFSAGTVTCTDMTVDLPETVKISFTAKKRWEFTLTLDSVNGKTQSRTFSKRFEKAVVKIKSQENKWDSTTFTLGVEADNDITVSNVVLTYAGGTAWTTNEFSDWEQVSALNNANTAQWITNISYNWIDGDSNTWTVSISKSVYEDFFKVGDDYAKVSKAKD